MLFYIVDASAVTHPYVKLTMDYTKIATINMAPKEAESFSNVVEPTPVPRVREVIAGSNIPRTIVFGDRPQIVCINNHWFPQERVDSCEGCESLDGSQLVQITSNEFRLLQILDSLSENERASFLAHVEARIESDDSNP